MENDYPVVYTLCRMINHFIDETGDYYYFLVLNLEQNDNRNKDVYTHAVGIIFDKIGEMRCLGTVRIKDLDWDRTLNSFDSTQDNEDYLYGNNSKFKLVLMEK